MINNYDPTVDNSQIGPQSYTWKDLGKTITLNSTLSNYSSNYAGAIRTAQYNAGSWGKTAVSPTWNNNAKIEATELELTGKDADIKIDGKSLRDFMNTMEKRLAILIPDPAKLEHFEALQKAYTHYKTLEALCELPVKEQNK